MKKTVTKKAVAKKTVKKAAVKKTVAKKATLKKVVKKTVAKKAAVKKVVSKPAVKKAAVKKPAVKRTATKTVAKRPASKVTKSSVRSRLSGVAGGGAFSDALSFAKKTATNLYNDNKDKIQGFAKDKMNDLFNSATAKLEKKFFS